MAKPNGNSSDRHSYPCFHWDKGKPYFYEKHFVSACVPAALELMAHDWIWIDDFKNHRLNEAGLAAAKELPKPEWKLPKLPALKPEDIAVLHGLEAAVHSKLKYYTNGWVTPLECGGSNGSHHSTSLTKLTRHGLATCRKGLKIMTGDEIVSEPTLQKRHKGSRSFVITDAGVAFLKNLRPE